MSNLMVILGIVIGITIFIGFLSLQAILLVPAPCPGFGCSTPTPDQATYASTLRGLAWIATIALDLSVAISVVLAFVMGARNDIPETTRRSAFYFATIYLAAYTVFGSLLMISVFSLFRYL